MMQLRLGVVLVISALSLAGCGRFALNNHSLDYKKAQALEPLKFLRMQRSDHSHHCIQLLQLMHLPLSMRQTSPTRQATVTRFPVQKPCRVRAILP